eukprot:14934724-Heterocapsa_arctica.AAC.1
MVGPLPARRAGAAAPPGPRHQRPRLAVMPAACLDAMSASGPIRAAAAAPPPPYFDPVSFALLTSAATSRRGTRGGRAPPACRHIVCSAVRGPG